MMYWGGVITLVAIGSGMHGTPTVLGAEVPNWQVSSSITYESGTFGTGTRTDIVYIPFTLKRLFDQGDLGLTLPFVTLRTTGVTTLVGGTLQQIRKGPKAPVTNSGVGDMILKGRYYAVDEHGLLPTIVLVAMIKFPTADESQGLGTGKFDEGVGVEVSRTFLKDFIAYFDISYTIIGSPAGTDLNNQTTYDIGLGYKFTPQLLGSVFYEERTALITSQPNPRSLLFNADYKVSQAFRFNALVEAGLSSGAPNYGFTAGGSVKF
jgi:hypothetical protein